MTQEEIRKLSDKIWAGRFTHNEIDDVLNDTYQAGMKEALRLMTDTNEKGTTLIEKIHLVREEIKSLSK